MLGEKHDIFHEFPNLEGKIRELYEKDPNFSRLMDKHDTLDAEIRDLEQHDQPAPDLHMEELKKKRLLLKDQIYEILRKQA